MVDVPYSDMRQGAIFEAEENLSKKMSKEVEDLLNENNSDEDIDISGISLEDILKEEKEEVLDDRDTFDEQQLLEELLQASSSQRSKRSKSRERSRDRAKDKKKQQPKLRTPLEVIEAREQQLLSSSGSELISPLQVKRRMLGQRKTSCSAKASDSKTSSATGVVKLECMDIISQQLKKNLTFETNGPGSPTAIAVHPKFIAIGTSKGLVIVFDHFQNVRQVLGNVGETEPDSPCTAIDVSAGGDFLICGFQNGRIVLWDMIKGTSLKAVSDAHESPVVSLRFYKDQKPFVISVDTKGIVNKLTFSKMMGYMNVVDTDLILDGAAGKIPAISVLPQGSNNNKCVQITDQYCFVALSSEQVTFIIAIEPEVKVLYRWPRPMGIQPDQPLLPSLAFGWVNIAGCARVPAPTLARGWGNHVQFVEVVFPGGNVHSHSKHGWPNFEEHKSIELCSPVLSCQWLGDQTISYLNSKDELAVFDTLSMQELEIVDVLSLELVYASYRANTKGGEDSRSFGNSFRACNSILYMLGLKELRTARVQSWTARIDTLIEDGEWLEALAVALEHYEGLKTAAAGRAERNRFPPVFFRDRRNDQCVVDIFKMSQTNQRTGAKEDVFRHEDGDKTIWCCGETPYASDVSERLEKAFQNARSGPAEANVPMGVAERVADLIMDYVRLAIANAPVSSKVFSFDLTQTHYQILAGVCIEFCAIIRRTDLLFNEIYKRFKDCDKSQVFLELLEPYILNNQLKTLPPEALHDFVKHYTENNRSLRLEQCLLHLRAKNLDFDTVIKLCHKHQLYSALIYVYNEGLKDYITPIDVLADACKKASRDNAESREKRFFGYKLLLYMSYCFQGKSFPMNESLPENEIPTIQAKVCRHIFQFDPESKSKPYPILRRLLKIDCSVLFQTISDLFEDPRVEFGESTEKKAAAGPKYNKETCPTRLDITLALAQVILGNPGSSKSSSFGSYEQSQMYMFEARLLSSGTIDAKRYADARNGSEQGMMDDLMRFLAVGTLTQGERVADSQEVDAENRQEMLVRLLQRLTRDHYDENTILRLVTRERMNRAAVYLYKERNEFSKTVKYYLLDADKEYQMNVFTYIRTEYEKVQAKEADASSSLSPIEKGVMEHAPFLLEVDTYALVVLILELLPKFYKKVIRQFEAMGSPDGARCEFMYLNQIWSDDSDIQELLDRSKIRLDEDSTLQQRYIALLCEYKSSALVPYLESHDNYNLEECLALCQKYGITDAEAFLLERTGDVNGALSLILQTIEQKLKLLKPALRGYGPTTGQESIIEAVQEGRDVAQTLNIAISMCQRNSLREQDDQAERLWFALVDKFLKIQNYVKKAIVAKRKTSTSNLSSTQTPMQLALNEYIRIVLERMASHVSLKKILFKITTEHGNDEFGEFRHTIFGMLETYKYEQNIYTTANGLISVDLYEQVMMLHGSQVKTLAPATNTCGYCGVELGKAPFNMGNSSALGGEKWHRQQSLTMIIAPGRVFHESCGKLWQQENDSKAQRKKSRRRRSNTMASDDGKDDGVALLSSETASSGKKQRSNQNTRRYLTRLKKARKNHKKIAPLHQVLDSLRTEDMARNKYLKSGGSSFSLCPGNPAKPKRIGSRKPGALPIKPAQKGAL